MADAYPHSAYGALFTVDADGQTPRANDTARLWAHKMRDVPGSAVLELCDRVLTRYTGDFPPDLRTFRKFWTDWIDKGFWDDENPVSNEPVLHALPAPKEVAVKGVGWRGHHVQMYRIDRGYGAITCRCNDAYGEPLDAMLSHDGKLWVCKLAQCDFLLAFKGSGKERGKGVARRLTKRTEPHAAYALIQRRQGISRRMTNDEILQNLRCEGFPSDRFGIERTVEFGRWLCERLPTTMWTQEICRAMWREFRAQPQNYSNKSQEQQTEAAAV